MKKAFSNKEPEDMTTQKGKKPAETPLMQQYNQIKAKFPDAILLFRVGDFYETFSSDAVTASKILGITLTKRANGSASEIELAGFPHHSIDTYLPKLVKAGYRVAICDQLEDPKLTKTIVKRGVTELVTPGVALNDHLLEHRSNNFLASLYLQEKQAGIAFLDISTGEFLTAQGSITYIEKLIQGFQPNEIVFSKQDQKEYLRIFAQQYYSYAQDEWIYTADFATETLLKHFGTSSLKGFGVDDLKLGIIAAGAALHYIKSTEHHRLEHISKLSKIDEDLYVGLDKFTIRNLELVHGAHPDSHSLIQVLDHTNSPMGARLLKRWILMPLKDLSMINERLDAVAYFLDNKKIADGLRELVKQIGDLERLVSKIATQRVGPREMLQVKRALKALDPMKQQLSACETLALQKLAEQINLFPILVDRIEKTLNDDAPAIIQKGNAIKNGFSEELDQLRDIIRNGKQYLMDIQVKESQATGISSLKIGFNNVFGYYLEVTNAHKEKVPAVWIRKQTLTGAERYITEELKVLEQQILGAEEKIQSLEERIYQELVAFVAGYIAPIQINAQLVARVDVLISLSTAAYTYKYCKPELNESLRIEIKDARHPVIERLLGAGDAYIPNDLLLDSDELQVMMITGPNMSGKSAVLRQTALIVLMAQMGSFVPATSASIGWVDKIFTRVGASDNISSGESTFMVEMNETASIVNNLSPRCLILLDEIGRGTSTYDGISIAWSLAEFLHNYPNARPKTLFATHYHELNELADQYERIKNYHISVKDTGQQVIFLRKLVPGGSEHSFGIHVAKMAGMPKPILERAQELLHQLEQKSITVEKGKMKHIAQRPMQLNIFDPGDPKALLVKEALMNMDINTLTPVEALWKLNELLKMLQG